MTVDAESEELQQVVLYMKPFGCMDMVSFIITPSSINLAPSTSAMFMYK